MPMIRITFSWRGKYYKAVTKGLAFHLANIWGIKKNDYIDLSQCIFFTSVDNRIKIKVWTDKNIKNSKEGYYVLFSMSGDSKEYGLHN